MRLVQYNVHRFLSSTGTSTLLSIAASLAHLSAHVVCLNEVDLTHQPLALEMVAARLGIPMTNVAFFGHVRGRYGNAIMSRYPIKRVHSFELDGGTEFLFEPGTVKLNGDIAREGETHRIARGIVLADVEAPWADSGVLRLGCTHLDHMKAKERVTQVRHIVRILDDLELQDIPSAAPHATVLAGDLNALTRRDYSPAEWQGLEERAAARGWEAPDATGADIGVLEGAGFEDVWRRLHDQEEGDGAVEEPSAAAAESCSGKNAARFTAHTGEPLYRIDYCLSRRRLGSHQAFQPIGAAVATDVTHSDHFPLVIDFATANEEGVAGRRGSVQAQLPQKTKKQ